MNSSPKSIPKDESAVIITERENDAIFKAPNLSSTAKYDGKYQHSINLLHLSIEFPASFNLDLGCSGMIFNLGVLVYPYYKLARAM